MWIIGLILIIGGFGAGIIYWQMRQQPKKNDVFGNLSDGVVILNHDNDIIQLNQRVANYLDEPAEHYIGQPYNTLLEKFDVNEYFRSSYGNPRLELIRGDYILETIESLTYDTTGKPTGKVIMFYDATRQNVNENRLNSRLEKLIALRAIYNEISEKLDVSSVMMFALDGAMRLSGADSGYIAVRNPLGQFEVSQVIGPTSQEQINIWLKEGKGIVNRVIRNEKAEWIDDVSVDSEYIEGLPKAQSLIIVPIFTLEEEMIGVITLATQRAERFTPDVFEFTQLLSNRISAGVTNAQLYEQVQQQLEELRTTNAHIKELEQLKTDMIRMAAHDLGTPLSTILLRVQLIQRSNKVLPEDVESSLDEIIRAANNIKRLRKNFLSLERIEELALKSPATSEKINLYEQTTLIIDSMMSLARSKNIEIILNVPERDAHIVNGEIDQLYEAISNLVSNAIKYTQNDGAVQISLNRVDEFSELRVTDNGYGIPENEQSKLFKPFKRIKTRETQDIDGTGLGLHLVKSIIDRHGGEIIFYSEYGHGSTFGFRLPAAHLEAKQEHTLA